MSRESARGIRWSPWPQSWIVRQWRLARRMLGWLKNQSNENKCSS
jgi:hypothetical protein